MAKTIANVLVGIAIVEVQSPVGGSWVEVGYTEDGARFEYTADTVDIEVEEETFPVERPIVRESLAVVVNMAESSLFNIDKAIAGSILAGTTITIGGGANKTMGVRLTGTNPAGFARTITIPLATATGAVGMAYRKGEKTVVPATFQALKGAGDVATIVDAAA